MNTRVFAVFLFLLGSLLQAQTTGVIEGTLRDVSGGVLQSASVTVTLQDTGAQRALTTDANGHYQALELTPGAYRVDAAADGLQLTAREGLSLSAGRTLTVDFSLRLGTGQEEVIVTADAALISIAASDWGGLVESEKLEDLPLNGRDLFELSVLEPGATNPTAARSSLAQGIGGQISVNGSRPNQNAYQIDGVYVNDATSSMPSSASGNLLGIETVREIHMVTNPFSAEVGRTSGGLFTAVSRSGGNKFHGALYEYFRNDALDAKNYFDSPGESIPPLRRNQFGGLLTGPIIKNKLFFVVNYEAIRERRGRTERPVVPNLAARSGQLPTGDVTVSPAAAPYVDLYPLPNGRDFGDGTGEFVNLAKSRIDEDFISGKVDWSVTGNVRASARYTSDEAEFATPDPMGIWTFLLNSRNHFFHSEVQTVHSANTVSTIRGAFSRVNNSETGDIDTSIPAELSFVEGQPMGTLTVAGLSNFGGFQARALPRTFILNSGQFNADVVHVAGSHTIRAGGGIDKVNFDQQSDLSFVGSYTFGSLESLLLGKPRIAEVAQPGSDTARDWNYWQFHGFVQDDWRIRPNLSLSLGVRYEKATVPTETDGKVAVLRDLINDSATTVGGPLWETSSGFNFAPRAAIAWDPFGGGKTVVRVGGGIFLDLLGSGELVIAGVRTPPLYNRILVFGAPGFPDILNAADGRTPSSAIDGLDFDLPQPYVGRWQLQVERQLGEDAVVRVGYTGMRGIHLMGQVGNFNTPVPETSPDGRLFFPDNGSRLNPAFSRIGLRRAQFNSFYQGLTLSLENRWRDRFRYQMKYGWSKSIDESSSGTFNDFEASDQVPTTYDYRLNRGPSEFDLTHVVAGSFSYLLPSLANAGALGLLTNDWEIHGLTQIQSGSPFAPSVGFDRARLEPGFGDVGQRPDLASGTSDSIVQGGPDQYFDPTAFSLPEAGFLGTLGRGTLRGPGLFTFDVSVHKSFAVAEGHRLNFRAEFFNITNTPNFQIPSGQELFGESGDRIGSAGRITSTTTGSRQVQLALRWEF
jgi:hypothetical protein